MIQRAKKEDLISALYDFYTDGDERAKLMQVSIAGLFDQWLDYKRLHGIAETTIRKYESDWRCHLKGTKIVNKTCKINTTEYSDSFVLSQLYADGKIDVSDVEEVVKLSKLENAIKPYHKNRIYRDDRGRWCTYVRDERKKSNRRQISKTHKADLLEELYRIYLDEDYVLEDKTTGKESVWIHNL